MNQQLKRRAGRPSAEEAEQKRQAVIVAALDEFARMGFHGASLRDIADKAEVSSRTLYNYFPDKLTLFEACLEYSGEEIQPDLPDFEGDLRGALVAYTIEMQAHLSEPQARRIAALIFRESGGFDELRRIARLQFERHQVMPVATLLKMHGFPAKDRETVAAQFVAMALGEWQRRVLFGGPPMTEKEMAAQAKLVTGIFLDGAAGKLRAAK